MTRDVLISFNKFADSALNINVVHWWGATDNRAYLAGIQDLNLKIKRRFDAAGIEFAFPTQTLYVKQESAGARRGYPRFVASVITRCGLSAASRADKGELLAFAFQPLGKVLFDVVRPFPVDLSGSVLALTQPQMAELIPQPNDLRSLDNLLGQVRRDKDDPFLLSQDNVARHHRRAADPDRHVDPHQHDIGNGGGVPAAIEHREIRNLFHPLDIACAAINDHAFAAGLWPRLSSPGYRP